MEKLKTTQDVYDLLNAAAASAGLGAAVETGLLWLLAEMPLDAASVSQALNIPGKRCTYWLQFLQSLGILEQNEQGYVPSSLAKTSILDTRSEGSWKHLVLDERERAAGVHSLALHVRTPGSVWTAQGMEEPRDYVEKMRLDLDENVCISGCEIAAGTPWANQIEYLPADLSLDGFPGGYDLALLCDLCVFGVDFFRKVWESLNPGSRAVIVNHFSLEDDLLPQKRIEWTFLDSLEDPFITYMTLARARSELTQAGFQVLSGERILSDQRMVLEACK